MDGPPRFAPPRLALGIVVVLTLAGQILDAERAAHIPTLGMTLRESRVISIAAGGPAANADVRPGDILTGVDGRPVTPSVDAHALLNFASIDSTITLQITRDGAPLALRFTPPRPSGSDILWRLALAAVGIVMVLIGALVYLKKPRDLTLIFCAICFGIGYLLHPPFVPLVPEVLLAHGILMEALTLLIPPLFVHLFLLFPHRHPVLQRRSHALALLYAPSLVLLILSLAVRARSSALGPLPWAPLVIGTGAALLWATGALAAIVLFIQSYRGARTPTLRRKVRVVLWGTTLGSLPVAVLLVLHQISPGVRIPGDRLAVISMILIPLSFAYAIVRHGLFDAALIARRSLVLSVLSAVLVITYFATEGVLRVLLREGSLSPLWISFASLLAVALLLVPAQQGVRALLGSVVDGARHGQPDLLSELGQALRGLQTQDRVICAIAEFSAEALGAERAAYFERTPSGVLEAAYLHGFRAAQVAPYRLTHALSQQLEATLGPIDRGDLESDLPFGYLSPSDQAVLETLGTEVLVPLRVGGGFKGILLIGGPVLGEPFGPEALQLAGTIADEGSAALENALLHAKVLDEERLKSEVDVARDLQERLLPTHLPQVESLELSGFSIPCRGVGGDYYDCFRTPWGEILLAIADVSGKGVPGAILVANLQGLVTAAGQRRESPARIVEHINSRLCEMEKPDRYVTLCLARIDPLTGTLAYCNAGHPSLLLIRADGAIEELTRGGLPLGIRAAASYEGGETIMRSGDVLILYTDGITERRHGNHEFGKERLHALASRRRRLSARALQDAILSAVRDFSPTPLDDDTTLLLVKML